MGLNILIVEDEAVIGLLLGEVLAEMGHQVCGIAATATEAIAAANMHRPDLMIVDINLAGENGSANVANLRAQSPTPCIFVGGDENIRSCPSTWCNFGCGTGVSSFRRPWV